MRIHILAKVKMGDQSNPHYKIVNDVHHYQLLTFINSIIRYLVSLDKNNN